MATCFDLLPLKRFTILWMSSHGFHYLFISEINGQIIAVPVQLYSTVDLPCICPFCPESTISVQWFRSSSSDTFIQDGNALAWWFEGDAGSSLGFGIKDDYSMVMHSVNLTNEGLYRCFAATVGADECRHDVKLSIYGKSLFISSVIAFECEGCFKFNAKRR